MGLDLELYPDRFNHGFVRGEPQPTYEKLAFDRDSRIFDQIAEPPLRTAGDRVFPRLVPRNFQMHRFREEGLKVETTDDYGNPLIYCTVAEFLEIRIPADATAWNRAIFAFLKELRPETLLFLVWC